MLVANLRFVLPLVVGSLIAVYLNLDLAESKPTPALINQSVAEVKESMSPQERKPSFPQLTAATKERAFPNALVEGTLTLTDGCLRIKEGDKFNYLIIWPPQTRLDLSSNSIRVFDEKSRVTARVGQTVRLGGGQIQTSAPILKELRYPLPNKCPGPYWLASGIVPYSSQK